MKKNLLLILATLVFYLVAGVCSVQALPKPSAPEFALKFVDNSHYVPPVYGVNQFTGETTITHAGYYVENRSITVSVKNQPFMPYYDEHGNPIALHYNIRFKGPFGRYWTEVYQSPNFPSPKYNENNSQPDYTEFYLPIGNYTQIGNVPLGGQIEIQIQAMIGYVSAKENISSGLPQPYNVDYTFISETGDWSSTQTITIPAPSPSSSASPTPEPTLSLSSSPSPVVSPSPFATIEPTQANLLLYVLVTIAAIVVAFVAGVIFALRLKRSKKN